MYKLIKELSGIQIVQRVSDNAFIPFDELNRDYQEYLEWLAQGNLPLQANETSNLV